jgi:hypothetical protein
MAIFDDTLTDEDDDKGIWLVFAYHCQRCNYLWFPKDYDVLITDDIRTMTPPKACARCKSKYWNRIPAKIENHDLGSVARRRANRRRGGKIWR